MNTNLHAVLPQAPNVFSSLSTQALSRRRWPVVLYQQTVVKKLYIQNTTWVWSVQPVAFWRKNERPVGLLWSWHSDPAWSYLFLRDTTVLCSRRLFTVKVVLNTISSPWFGDAWNYVLLRGRVRSLCYVRQVQLRAESSIRLEHNFMYIKFKNCCNWLFKPDIC